MITVGVEHENVASVFENVEEAATVMSEYARPSETNMLIYIGRQPKMSLREIWPKTKSFI